MLEKKKEQSTEVYDFAKELEKIITKHELSGDKEDLEKVIKDCREFIGKHHEYTKQLKGEITELRKAFRYLYSIAKYVNFNHLPKKELPALIKLCVYCGEYFDMYKAKSLKGGLSHGICDRPGCPGNINSKQKEDE